MRPQTPLQRIEWSGEGGPERQPQLPRRAALLTVQDVAERLNVSTRTVRRLVAAGRLPCIRIGRSLRFDPVSVDQVVAAWEE